MNLRRLSAAATFVGVVWALMFFVTLVAIAQNGRNIPFAEDWSLVAPVTGHQHDYLGWLWSQNNEHRVPVPRLVALALLKLTGDYRAGMVFNATVLAAVAMGMILVVRRLRGGRTTCADAFFPLMLLHLGQWDNIVWSWQMQFVLATALVCTLLLILVAHGGAPGARASLSAALALIALPLTGATGLPFVLPLALWMVAVGVSTLDAGQHEAARRRSVTTLLCGAIAATLLVGMYFVGWQRPPWNPASPDIRATLSFAVRFLAFGFGPGVSVDWHVAEAVALLLVAATVILVVGAIVRGEPSERVRSLGLIAFIAGALVLALLIGAGRAGRGRMSPRYALLGVPIFCAAYFVWELYGPPALRRSAQAGLLLIALILLPLNTQAGLQRRDWFGRGFQALERDLAADLPRTVLAERHHKFLQEDAARVAEGIRMLQQAHVGPFARVRDDAADPIGKP